MALAFELSHIGRMGVCPPTYAIILAAGAGARFGAGLPKQFVELCGRPLLAHSLQVFEDSPSVTGIALVISAEYRARALREIVEAYEFKKITSVVEGGATRAESTANGLNATGAEAELIAIHDGARPTVAAADIARVIEAAARDGAALLASPVSDTLKRVACGRVVETVDRGGLFAAETPQVFASDLIRRAHQSGSRSVTDDSQAVEALGVSVTVIESSGANIKITRPEDVTLA
ncbi:MAG: 2-C-methyl-D-erythritol 4-phosphate cytidylyltransferase, partial [Candidatus Zixiibacteriota bacterium]